MGDAPYTLCYSIPLHHVTHSYDWTPSFPCLGEYAPQKPNPTLFCRLELVFPLVAQGSRTATDQALWQLGALPITLLLAALGGGLGGEFCLSVGQRVQWELMDLGEKQEHPQNGSFLCTGAGGA